MDELPPLVKWAQDSPPLPDPYGWFDIRGEAADGFTADQMRAYAAAAVAMERERCAKVCEDEDVASTDDALAVQAAIAAAIRGA